MGQIGWEAPISDELFEVPRFTIPREDHWYEPMSMVHLEIGQEVFISSHDGSGEYAYAWVLKKEIKLGVYRYWLGEQHQLGLF